MKECPCKNCVPPKRFVGCHSTCKLYIKWDKEHKKLKTKEIINKYYANL